MINKIKQNIEENKTILPLFLIYNNLQLLYNIHDIKFTLLTFFNYDVDLELSQQLIETEKRQYQQMLRRQALTQYNNKCVISNIDEDLLLEVAHIKPVSKCDNIQEKADVNNVLLLWIDIHKYFDNYKLTINPQTSKVEVKCNYLMKYNGLHINLTDKNKEYLQHHYNIFTNLLK